MILASQLKAGSAIQFEGHPYKVLIAEYHSGQGKMGGSTHARLQNLDTGALRDYSFRSDMKLEELALERKPMDFLYSDETSCYFMDPATCEQEEVPLRLVGEQAKLLAPEMRVSIEFLGERVVSVQLPDFLELKVADTAPPAHSGGQDNTWKAAHLENGLTIMVPQFIKPGDSIRVDVAQMKYMDRVKTTGR
jgi:elongation factor P